MIDYVTSRMLQVFTQRATRLLIDILQQEMKIELRRTRFLYRGYTFPLTVFTFEHPKYLGMFQVERLRLGLNRRLSYLADQERLKDILRHEMAHYMTWIEQRANATPHGAEFQEICRRYGWGSHIASATMDEEHFHGEDTSIRHQAMVGKIKKLLALATSDNQAEANAACAKANELILKYNLQWLNETTAIPADELLTHTKEVLKGTRQSAKEQAIYHMLKVFHVEPVFSSTPGHFSLEVVGEECNVELAVHAGQFLEHHLEHLWQSERRKNQSLKGLRARHSFFLGIANGFCQRHADTQEKICREKPDCQQSLVLVEKKLKHHLAMAYPRLRHQSHHNQTDHHAFARGELAGRDLSIHPAVRQDQSERHLLL